MARMPGVGFHSGPHFGRGRGSQVNGIVIHQFAGGTVPAIQNWLRDSRSRVSYHFGVGRNGEIRQWVDTNDTAWATGPVNGRTIAIGHEANNTAMVTPAQIDATARIIRWARGAHRGIPAGRNALTGHRQHMSTTCPGNPIMAQLDDLQRRSAGTAPPPPPPPPPPSGVPAFPGTILRQPPIMRGHGTRVWQQRVNARSDLPAIAADDAFGPISENAARAVQRIAGLTQDGRVGPNTWPATWTTGAGAIGGVRRDQVADTAFWRAPSGGTEETHRVFRRASDGAIMYSRNGGAYNRVMGWVARGDLSIAASPSGWLIITFVDTSGRVMEGRSAPGFRPWTLHTMASGA
jgi:hypothetical protein